MYMAWCDRWNAPTPKCTIPVRTRDRSYVGADTELGRDANDLALSGCMGWSFHAEGRPGHLAPRD
jgi:hypothetical protein